MKKTFAWIILAGWLMVIIGGTIKLFTYAPEIIVPVLVGVGLAIIFIIAIYSIIWALYEVKNDN